MTIIPVRPTGSDAIPAALAKADPGDTVELSEGTYPAFDIHNLHGKPGKRIVIQGAPGERQPVIDAGLEGSCSAHCIHCRTSGSWFTLRNLTLTNTSPYVADARECDITTKQGLEKFRLLAGWHDLQNKGGIRLNGRSPFRGILVEQCRLHHLPSYGISGHVTGSTFQHNRIYDLWSGGEAYGAYFWGSSSVKFLHNIVHDCAGWGLTMAGMQRAHVYGNTFADPRWPYYHYNTDVVKGEDHVGGISAFQHRGQSGDRNRFQRNRIYGGWWGVWNFAGETRAKIQGNEISQTHHAIYDPDGRASIGGNRLWGNVADVQRSPV